MLGFSHEAGADTSCACICTTRIRDPNAGSKDTDSMTATHDDAPPAYTPSEAAPASESAPAPERSADAMRAESPMCVPSAP